MGMTVGRPLAEAARDKVTAAYWPAGAIAMRDAADFLNGRAPLRYACRHACAAHEPRSAAAAAENV
ncbi:protein of unknown function [Burkholderia multivorans]